MEIVHDPRDGPRGEDAYGGAAGIARYGLEPRSFDFVVDLSSQTGCARACRRGHPTATGQTRLRDATIGELAEQAATVFDHSRSLDVPARTVHSNFMASRWPAG